MIEKIKKVLDKYKNQEPTIKINDKGVFIPVEVQELIKYKNAYEDLRFMVIDDYFHRVQELEQKHGIKED